MRYLIRTGLTVLLVLMMCLGASPVFADDPPDPPTPPPPVNVDVGVSTPGNVDLNVGINAGGDVDVTVDGVNFKKTAALANSAVQPSYLSQQLQGGCWGQYDVTTYVAKQLAPYSEALRQINGLLNLITDAQAKLILEKAISDGRTAQLTDELGSLEGQLTVVAYNSEREDERIMKKIVYGAEAHIAAQEQEITRLSNRVDLNQETIEGQITQINAQIQALENKRITDYNNLVAYVQAVRNEYISMFEGVAAILFALLVGLGLCTWKLARLRKRINF